MVERTGQQPKLDPWPAKGLPYFQYCPPSPDTGSQGTILANQVSFHVIADLGEFYEALGCQPDPSMLGWLPEELIWNRYSRDGAAMGRVSIPVQRDQ